MNIHLLVATIFNKVYNFLFVYSYIWETRIYFHSLGENIQASLIFFHSFICIFVCVIYAFVHRYIHQILSKHVLPSLMEALFNVPAKSAFPNVVRSDKTQVPVNQVSLPVSHRPGATLSRTCPQTHVKACPVPLQKAAISGMFYRYRPFNLPLSAVHLTAISRSANRYYLFTAPPIVSIQR